MSEVLSVFFATLMGFVILEPVHLLWINLITDCFPALAQMCIRDRLGLGWPRAEAEPAAVAAASYEWGLSFQTENEPQSSFQRIITKSRQRDRPTSSPKLNGFLSG